jgi:hypothetical protein
LELEPKAIGTALYRRNWSRIWIPLLIIAIAILEAAPSRLSQWITAILVLAPALWVVLGGPAWVYRIQNQTSLIAQIVVLVVRVGFALVVLWYVVPWLNSKLDSYIGA